MLKSKPHLAIAICCLLSCAIPAKAHETDQYTSPQGREFADFGPYLTKFMYDAISKGVEYQNTHIRRAISEDTKGKDLDKLQSNDELASAVNRQFPIALFLIDNLDHYTTSDAIKPHYPGKLIGFKTSSGIRKYVDIPLSPFNAWSAATIKAYGHYIGNDKVGHFSDMGMHYYTTFRNAKRSGASDADAMKKVLYMGEYDPVFSERGLLGLATAGAYSNADLVGNYMGFLFYRNLSEPVMLKGVQRPPLVVKDGQFWKVADFVRPDSDFFSWFISNHLDEALNPSLYLDNMHGRIRKAIVEHRVDALSRYVDVNGNSWSQRRFEQETQGLVTYYGADYGHWGGTALMTIARTCFAPPPDMNSTTARNDDGLAAMHVAAARNDTDAIQRLIDHGADVNIRVVSKVDAPVVDGDTPLHLAVKDGQLEAAKLLLSRGADVNARNARGDMPLHMAVEFPRVAELLIKSGANIDAATATGRTPLHWAARDAMASASLQLLLDNGAKPQPVDHEGQTPLHDAAAAGHMDAIVALVKGGADVNATDHFGATPLHLAAAVATGETCDLLVQAGANVESKDDFGATPLLVATRNAQPKSVAVLLARNANPNAADTYGKTPLAIAEAAHFTTISQLLENRGQAEAQTAGAKIPPTPNGNGPTEPQSNAR